jgi:hypothetical protein
MNTNSEGPSSVITNQTINNGTINNNNNIINNINIQFGKEHMHLFRATHRNLLRVSLKKRKNAQSMVAPPPFFSTD